jgi:hypothetical protein
MAQGLALTVRAVECALSRCCTLVLWPLPQTITNAESRRWNARRTWADDDGVEEGAQVGEVWKHHNLRVAYIAQHSMHHLEANLSLTPITYIQDRFFKVHPRRTNLVECSASRRVAACCRTLGSSWSGPAASAQNAPA